MAYNNANLFLVDQGLEGGIRRFVYWTSDTLATVLGASYFSDGVKQGMKLGDVVEVFVGTLNTAITGSPSTADVGGASVFSAISAHARTQVSATSGNAATVVALPQVIGPSATSLVGFYGATPVAQPAVLAAITTTQPTLTVYGFTTTAQFNLLIAAVNTILADLKTLGLVATA